jgi:parallel beta-helix repeat protein
MLIALLSCVAVLQDKLQTVLVEHDDTEIARSCTVDTNSTVLVDANGDGLIHVVGSDIVVQFARTPFTGSAPNVPPDEYKGIGVRVSGKNVTLRGAIVQGFKAGIVANKCDGLVLEGCEVSNNYHQHLKSTPQAEDGADWLYPHHNDADEWLTNYGAGIYVSESNNVTLRYNRSRNGQNGICLRRVNDSKIYDNDMSWMSGWGLALYRCSKNVVSHNSFDFCIRGYSHGVYARGQDSAGILCFEQCCDNVFAYNSATHGGDGFFGFAGSEALEGEMPSHEGVGCNRNLLYGNDFSYAAAIGIEMTFSFDNRFEKNKLAGSNYGVWGGYSQGTAIVDNEIAANTISGIAIEHGSRWDINHNSFAKNERAIELWWNENPGFATNPWGKVNPTDSSRYTIRDNRFDADKVQLELRGGTKQVLWYPNQDGADRSHWRIDDKSEVIDFGGVHDILEFTYHDRLEKLPGKRVAVGALKPLEGRDKIIITEWGPYDWHAPYLQRVSDRGEAHVWRLLGDEMPLSLVAGQDVVVKLDASVQPAEIVVSPRKPGTAAAYELVAQMPSKAVLKGKAVLLACNWHIGVFAYKNDPREKLDAWHDEAKSAVFFDAPRLKLDYGMGGPSDLPNAPDAIKAAKLPKEHFGTIATTSVLLPKGDWQLKTNSDDGVRVWIGGVLMVDNWTWHGPTVNVANFDVDGTKPIELRVEHFELDGFSVLEVELERVSSK